ncbi:MAG TPA: phosphatase PAP2 family protein [Pseudonocardiaceae bacterium]|jgi:undecaprenyl-diphosphatase
MNSRRTEIELPARAVLFRAAAVGLVVFVTLWVLVGIRWAPLVSIDDRAVAGAHGLAVDHAWLATVSRVVTDLGSPVAADIVTAVAAVVALVWRHVVVAVVIVGARLGELGTVAVVKLVADRARPSFAQPLATASGNSFPSGHSAGSAALYGVLLLLVISALARGPRVAVVVAGIVFVVAVGASRIFLGVHHPTDVVAGLAIGGAWAAAAVGASAWLPRAGVGRTPTG